MHLLSSTFLLLLPALVSSRLLSPLPILHRRSGDSLLPRESVVLPYREAATTGPVYHASLTVHAHASQPLLVLEAVAAAAAVACTAAGVTVRFAEAGEAEWAADMWSGTMMVIAPRGCVAGEDDRVPYRVHGAEVDGSEVVLAGAVVAWRDAGKRMGIELGYEMQDQLAKRQKKEEEGDGEEMEHELSLKSNLPERVLLFPPPPLNKTGDGNGKEEAEGGGKASAAEQALSAVTTDLQVHCVGCGTDGKILVKAAFDFDTDLLPFSDTDDDDDDEDGDSFDVAELDSALLEVEILEDLRARANLEMFVGAETQFGFTQRVFPVPLSISPFQLGAIVSVGPIFDFEVALDIRGPSASANFTYGAELVVAAGAKARLAYGMNESDTTASGWDKAEVNELPFNVNSLEGDLSFEVNITARPKFTFGILVGAGLIAQLDAGFELDLPKLYAKATALTNVTSDCEAPGRDDYEYYRHAINIETGAGLAIRAVAQLEAGGKGAMPALLNQEFDHVLLEKDFAAGNLCLAIDRATLGALESIDSTEPELDTEKVQRALDETGHLPDGIDPRLFPSATAASDLGDASESESERASASARARSMCGVLLAAVGAGFFLL